MPWMGSLTDNWATCPHPRTTGAQPQGHTARVAAERVQYRVGMRDWIWPMLFFFFETPWDLLGYVRIGMYAV